MIRWRFNCGKKLFAGFGIVFLFLAGYSRAAEKERPPNIVFVVGDALRKDHLQLYGYPKNTMPVLSSYLKKGIIFTDFFSTGSHTLSTHYSIFSGEFPDQAAPKNEKSFIQELMESGYRTYGISANSLLSSLLNYPFGFDVFNSDVGYSYRSLPQIISKREDYDLKSKFANPMSGYLLLHLTTTADIVNNVIYRVLDDHFGEYKDQPFFLFVNYFETHDPYFPHSADTSGVNYNYRDEKGLQYEFFRNVSK